MGLNLAEFARQQNELEHAIGIKRKVLDVLRGINDPELAINVYDLGLIYDIEVSDEGRAHIVMTLTAPGCPVAATFPASVECAVRALPEIKDACVELVWDPPWDRDRMSKAAKLQLGLL